jgi:hypothetical protein
VARIWRNSPGQLLAIYLILGGVALAVAASPHPSLPVKDQPFWFPVLVFLAWRVSRGGRISRLILILLSMSSFAGAAFTHTPEWSPRVLALLAIYGTQVALLVSPAIYQRTRRYATADRLAALSIRWTPPFWLPLSALLTGLVATFLSLGNEDWAAIPGCGPAGATIAHLPSRCIGLAQGSPMRFLTAYQGTPLIDKVGFAEDWAHWAIVSFAVFYIWLLLHRRPEVPPGQPVRAESPAVA